MVDEAGAILLRFEQNATGVLTASQVAAGEENALKIRVYGENGGLEWAQMEPNTLTIRWGGRAAETLRARNNYSDCESTYATHNCRTPCGHPESSLKAFCNL